MRTQYKAEGFFVIKGLLSPQIVDALAACVNSYIRSGGDRLLSGRQSFGVPLEGMGITVHWRLALRTAVENGIHYHRFAAAPAS